MPEENDSPIALTRRAVESRESDPSRARELLGAALAEDKDYEPAWRWLAELVDDDAERRFCLDRAFAIEADAATGRARRALDGVTPVPPAEVVDLVDPPRPEEPEPVGRGGRGGVRSWIAVGAVAVALLGVLGVWSASGSQRGEPVYVAMVAGMTGHGAAASKQVENSLRMHLEAVNGAGGVNGHPVELLVYDDADDVGRATGVAETIVRENRVMYVVGHGSSDTALAAAPIYQRAKIPAITPSATSSRITDSSDWYFRSMFGNRTQADFLAVYLSDVLGAGSATLVHDDDESGRSVRDAFLDSYGRFGTVSATLPMGPGTSVDEVVRAVDPAVPVVLAVEEERGLEVVKGLRAAGVSAPILGTATLGTRTFHDALLEAERAGGQPGRLTGNLYVGTPLANDSLSGPALAWAEDYQRRYGEQPLWQAATARQALNVGLHAMSTGDLAFTADDRARDRQRVRDSLAALKDKKNSFPALLGPLYFTPNGSAQMPVSMVTSDGTRFVSAPVQLTTYEPPSPDALRAALADGSVIAIGDRYLSRRQVVSTGINLNEVRDLDTRDGTYFVDFFLWLRYTGDHVASDVQFVNAVKPDLKLGQPLRDVTENGATYRLYRVGERFKSGFEFRGFPFDHQKLVVMLQNRTRTADQVVYATDKEILNEEPSHYLRSGADAGAGINQIPNWVATSARFFQRTVGSSDALGDSDGASGIFYSQYAGEIEIARDTLPFLIKNLLPLVLLICVTYLSLFFSAADGSAPVSMGVTAILSTAVLLNNVTSQLPSVSYTVALEWGYYAFILLAATCVLIAMLRKRFATTGHQVAERRLSKAARVGYPVFLLGVVITYVVAFGT
ncbi:ABC transporter substrate-binding protein [Umezawaea sp. Da 62-37]|uniref:ABC transporter substrate-binding protein n=1 Tax=Umezawaea sp. Da 62-37 TaxID=3075927 RepID=UPI0028F6E716|nr:ABC transporter substrate-binding protein [Umezawaea sp. Da 62-37]WNV89056.1 ABC transporter substrate-binding protein [Umezawaea sp. Da 62-37]